MTPPTAPERCPTCDREGLNCPTLETLVRGTLPQTEVRRIAIAAMQDCHAHRVDWRARAIAAEAERSEIVALVSPSSDQSLPDAVRELCEHVEELRPAAAQWAKVAPLIDRLRAECGAAPFRGRVPSLIECAAAILADTEATP